VKIGELVRTYSTRHHDVGLIVGFNKKSEGGKHFVHVYINDIIHIIIYVDLEIL